MKTLLKRYLGGKRKIYLEYGLLALLIILPLLKPGYIFALDMVFTPTLHPPETISNLYLFSWLLHVLDLALPSDVIQKILLLAIIMACGIGAHRLAEAVSSRFKVKSKRSKFSTYQQWGAYFAGVLYMINPFTYSRFMSGQYLVVAGYALIPFFILALWRFLANPTVKNVVPVTLLAIAMSLLSIHSLFFIALIVVISLAAWAKDYRHAWRRVFGLGAAAVFIWLLAGSYWLLPIAQGKSSETELIAKFDESYVEGFQTADDPHYGVVFNAASLYGFWGDRENRYELPKEHLSVWPLISLAFIALAVVGGIVGWKRGLRSETGTLAAIGAGALVLGIGIAYEPLAPLYYWMIDNIPLYQGFREPQKFIGLLVLAYAILGSIGASYIIGYLAKAKSQSQKIIAIVTPAILVALPIIYTPLMLNGFSGQLKASDYPKDWYSLNQTFNKDRNDFVVLFLPWHQYLSFPFTHTVVANPAKYFFDKPVIQGDNIEFAGIFRQESTPETLYVENKILRPHFEITDVGSRLKTLKVKYIVVAKNSDAKMYEYLAGQKDLVLTSNTPNLLVYQNIAYRP